MSFTLFPIQMHLSVVTKRYKVPRFAQASTSLMIIDPLQQVNEPPAALQKQSPIELSQPEPTEIVADIVVPEGQVENNKQLNKFKMFPDVLEQMGFAVYFGLFIGHHSYPGYHCWKIHLPANASNAH